MRLRSRVATARSARARLHPGGDGAGEPGHDGERLVAGRMAAAAAAFLGGCGDWGLTVSDSHVELLVPGKDGGSPTLLGVKALELPCYQHTCTVLEDGAVLIAGGLENDGFGAAGLRAVTTRSLRYLSGVWFRRTWAPEEGRRRESNPRRAVRNSQQNRATGS